MQVATPLYNKKYLFCFTLNFNTKLNCFLPEAYIVDSEKPLKYIDKKASTAVLENLGIFEKDLNLEIKKILAICQALHPHSILKKYTPKNKSIKTLPDLVKDTKIKNIINQYINLQLDTLLNLLQKNNSPLTIEVDKNKDFSKNQVFWQTEFFEPYLIFDKLTQKIDYTLLIKTNQTKYYPSEKNVILILDHPAWIVVDKKITRLQTINANKLKPFLTKKTVEIPSNMTANFFEKFIKEIAQKVDFEANSFEIIKNNKLKKCIINSVFHFLENTHLLTLFFDYEGYIFDAKNTKNRHSTLDLSDLNNIKVIQYIRNQEEENQFITKLLQKGLTIFDKNYFTLTKNKNPFAIIDWFIENQEILKNEGFYFNDFLLDGKKLLTSKPKVSFNNQLQNDWFDIEITILCGNYQFNFQQIVPLIKSKKRLYLLPNGTYFLIPQEWFTTFEMLAKKATIKGNTLQLPKSNFTVFEGIPQLKETSKIANFSDFVPSKLVKATLRPYQIEGVKWLLNHYKNGLGCLVLK